MSSLAQRMNDMLLSSAEAGGAESMEVVEKIISDAAHAQRPVIEDLLDSRQMSEEDFLFALSQRLNLPWEPNLKPRHARRLKEVCSSAVALRYRLLPLWYGDVEANMALTNAERALGEDDNAELLPEPPVAAPDAAEGGAGGTR